MKISRVTVVTLGVDDLARSTAFYEAVLETPPNTRSDGVTFIELPGTWLSLFPLGDLARDISPEIVAARSGFSGITLAHNARSREDVTAIIERARAAGAAILKEPQPTFWGGFGGYFADPDGYHWEVVWGPMFEFDEAGNMAFRSDDTSS